MSGMEDDWKNKVTFNAGRYAQFHIPTQRWYLFDVDGNNLGSGKTIREVENLNGRVK